MRDIAASIFIAATMRGDIYFDGFKRSMALNYVYDDVDACSAHLITRCEELAFVGLGRFGNEADCSIHDKQATRLRIFQRAARSCRATDNPIMSRH